MIHLIVDCGEKMTMLPYTFLVSYVIITPTLDKPRVRTIPVLPSTVSVFLGERKPLEVVTTPEIDKEGDLDVKIEI